MKTAEEMTRDVLKRRDEELIKRKKRRKTLGIAGAALAACLLLAVLIPQILPQNEPRDGTQVAVDPADAEKQSGKPDSGADRSDAEKTAGAAGDDETAATETQAAETEEPAAKIIWTAGGERSGEDSSGEIPQTIADNVYVDSHLAKILEKAQDDDVLAFVFAPIVNRSGAPYDQVESDRLYRIYDQAENASYELHERLADELMESRGMTSTEAYARVSNRKEYQEARNAAYQALQAVSIYQTRAMFEGLEDALDVMREKGFTVLCTNAEDGYADYWNWYAGMAVCTGTAAQIKALRLEGFGPMITGLDLDGTGPIERDPDMFGDGEYPTHLQDDSKLTDELRAAYAANGGAPVKVIVKMGWSGDWVDPHEYAYAALGMTEEEFNEARDLTNAQLDKYYETLIYYTYWVHEDVVDSILQDGELVERREWSWDFIAMLSEERALEVCEPREGHEQVAYIMLYETEEQRQSRPDWHIAEE